MKKLFGILIVAGLLLALVDCVQIASHPNVENTAQEEENEWGITLSAEDVTPTGMTLVCTQSGGTARGSLETGSPFAIEQEADGVWLPVGIKPGLDFAWTMEAWIIQRDASVRWNVDWSFLYGSLEPGVYRIKKTISDFRSPGDYTDKPYYAEFAIVD